MKRLGLPDLPGIVSGMGRTLTDTAGIREAVVRTVFVSACRMVGLKVPVEASPGTESCCGWRT